jgi:hypothetical protein
MAKRTSMETRSDGADGVGMPRAADSVPARGDCVRHDEIARLAYVLWEARGRPEGSAEEDWIRAEEELIAGQESL